MRRIIAFFAFMGAFTLAYYLGTLADVGEAEAKEFVAEFGKIIEGIDAPGIFYHNAALALPMFVPGLGAGWGLFTAWSTGYAFAAITSAHPEAASIPPLAVLYLSPFGVMELVAYSLAVSRSYLLAHTMIRRRPITPHLRATALEVAAVAGLLLAGGYIEHYMIKMIEAGGSILEI